MPLKLAITGLVAVIAFLQTQLWLGDGSIPQLYRLHLQIEKQSRENLRLAQRNSTLNGEIQALKHNPQAIEEVARRKLGMIGKDESFFLVIDRKP